MSRKDCRVELEAKRIIIALSLDMNTSMPCQSIVLTQVMLRTNGYINGYELKAKKLGGGVSRLTVEKKA